MNEQPKNQQPAAAPTRCYQCGGCGDNDVAPGHCVRCNGSGIESHPVEQPAATAIDDADRALLVEASRFGQFDDDFDVPLAKPIRAALRRLCAASANETGAKGAAAAWMSTDDPRDCISDAKKRDMIEHAGTPGARLAEKYSIALGVITPAQAADSPIVDDALRYRTLINMLDRHEAVVVIAGVSNVGSAMLDAMLDRFKEPK